MNVMQQPLQDYNQVEMLSKSFDDIESIAFSNRLEWLDTDWKSVV